MQYALLIYSTTDGRAEAGAESEGAREDWEEYFAATRDAGVFVAAQGLNSVDTATTVRMSGGELLVSDGPFAETKEHLLGFYLIDAADLDGAIQWASRMPLMGHGSVEIRPLLPRLPDVGRRW